MTAAGHLHLAVTGSGWSTARDDAEASYVSASWQRSSRSWP